MKNLPNIRLIITDSYQEMSRVSAEIVLGFMHRHQPRVNISITAGRTPAGMYEQMIPLVLGKPYFNHVHFYNFDEIPYKKSVREGITISALREQFFTPAQIRAENIHVLDHQNYQQWDRYLTQQGGLDLMVLGIGADGHYCGNLPDTTRFTDYTTRVECDDKLKNIIRPLYQNPEDIPDYYITMGARSVMSARNLLLFANGAEKAEIIQRILCGNVEESIPASILTMHPRLTIVLDKEAAAKISSNE